MVGRGLAIMAKSEAVQGRTTSDDQSVEGRLAAQMESIILARLATDRLVVPALPAAAVKCIRLLKDPEKVGGWMFTVVRRQVADVVEAESRSGAPLHRRLDDQLDVSSGRLSSEAQFELRTLLGEARQGLSPRRREIVELCLGQDLRQEDAATSLGCSVGAVKKELHVARGQLKQTLEALEVAPSTLPLAPRGRHRASEKA